MATKIDFDWSGSFDSAGQASERLRERRLYSELQRALPAAAGLASALGDFFDRLPEALLKAQEQELKRLEARYGTKDPRVVASREALDAATQMRTTGQSLRQRAERVAESAFASTWMLHGYVSAADNGAPVDKVDVVLSSAQAKLELRARTDDTGYFRFAPDARLDRHMNAKTERGVELAQPGSATGNTTDSAASTARLLAALEVRSSDGKLLHSDPVPVVIDREQPLYREIVIGIERPLSADEAKRFWSGWR